PGPIATNIARGARNRPDHLGGPLQRPTDEAVLAERLARTGIDPQLVGERGIDAIRNKTFFALVSALPAHRIKARPRPLRAPHPPHRGGARDALDDAVLGVAHSAVMPPSTNSRAPVT